MALCYVLCCVVLPLLLLPACIIARATSIRIACWDWVTYNGFFRLCQLRYRIRGTFIESGFILANHRSWCDFAYDPFVSGSAVVGRPAAFAAMLFQALLGFIEQRFIVLSRARSRHEAFASILRFTRAGGPYSGRVLFWPEGTRRSHTQLTLLETARLLKPGLLKSIYEHRPCQMPVQIMLSRNKELVFDEKRLRVGIGEIVYTELSDAIDPRDFATFEAFYDRVCVEWFELWQRLYAPGES